MEEDPPPYNPNYPNNPDKNNKNDPPPLYENWYKPDADEEFRRGPYDNPLTVGLMSQQPQTITYQPQPHTIVIMPVVLGTRPARMNCPHCLADIQTGIRQEPNAFAYATCCIMCMFGFWCCCCIPFCMDSCQDTEHQCPNCQKIIGKRRG